jgi:hypothetical protein
MSATLTIDDSPPGSWRAALEPNGSCAACRQRECSHPDVVYQGLVPLPERRR